MSEEMPTCTSGPLTVDQVLRWYDDSDSSRNRGWLRFMALRDTAISAMMSGNLDRLGDVLRRLDDEAWIPPAANADEP